MQCHNHNHYLSTKTMHIAEQLPQRDVTQNIPHVAISNQWAWRIENHQNNARNRFPHKHECGKPSHTECRVNICYFRMVETRTNMQPKTISMRAPEPIRISTSKKQMPPSAQVLFNSRALRGILTGWMCLRKLANEVDACLMKMPLFLLSQFKPPILKKNRLCNY